MGWKIAFTAEINEEIYTALLLCLLVSFVFCVIFFVKGNKTGRNIAVVGCIVLVCSVVFFCYQFGVRKVSLPLLNGNKVHTAYEEIYSYTSQICEMELKEVDYTKQSDPTQKAGGNDCIEITYYSGKEESYVWDGDYMLVISGSEKKLYKIMKE